MAWGLLAAVLSAICYGVASVLQALAARTTPAAGPRGLVRVIRQLPFLAGMLLDVAGFVAQFVALRTVPVFAVQATQASNLAVTAVVAVPVLGLRLTSRQWAAVAAVCVGLGLLALSAGVEGAKPTSQAFRVGLLVCAAVLGALGFAANRLPEPAGSLSLGAVAGLGFGLVALSARSITAFSLSRLLPDPAVYALGLAGVVSFLVYTLGLQRAAVTTVTGAVVVAETVPPAIVGVVVFGDGTRPGFLPVAVLGFLLAVGGAFALARFGGLDNRAAQTSEA